VNGIAYHRRRADRTQAKAIYGFNLHPALPLGDQNQSFNPACLAGLCPAKFNDRTAFGFLAEIMIETDNAIDSLTWPNAFWTSCKMGRRGPSRPACSATMSATLTIRK
jgi:hypothetical protein